MLFGQAYGKAASVGIATKGFEKSDIFLFNNQTHDESDFLPAKRSDRLNPEAVFFFFLRKNLLVNFLSEYNLLKKQHHNQFKGTALSIQALLHTVHLLYTRPQPMYPMLILKT